MMENVERAAKFLKDAETYYLATADGDQPRVRPFGTAHVYEGRLYIQTGKVKDVSRQILANPKVEICAFNGNEWIRIAGSLVEDDRVEARASMLDAYPSLKNMYAADDGNTQVFYFKDAVATISSFTHEPETFTF
ncbi:MAG: pyridoxamine 5'-phosphate oxidase family protein [Lachnospiraceae bacterium]